MVFRTSEFYRVITPGSKTDQVVVFPEGTIDLDITFRIIDYGSIPLTYHPDGEKNAIDDSELHWNLYDNLDESYVVIEVEEHA